MALRTVGKVALTYIVSKEKDNTYSDGDRVENRLLDLFKAGLTDEKRRKILNGRPSWPIRYHLAYERQDLLNWYEFPDGASVLEVGAGCGSITESLVQNPNIKIVANELSERRSLINAYRNQQAGNLEIAVGNLDDYEPATKFDYIVCVGVLEYSGSFIKTKSSDPYQLFLSKLRSLLKPNGKLLLAIENQLGLKYLAGAREDHTGDYVDGLNDYPHRRSVRTFSKKELEQRLRRAGFHSSYFYYPFPDYKLPVIIYSDDYYPGKDGVRLPTTLLPSPNPDQPRQFMFSEQAFEPVLERADLFRELSNSFLVEATL